MKKLNLLPFHPTYWPAWFLILLLLWIAHLPNRLRLFVGKGIGKILYFSLKNTRKVTDVNLQLCFPELTKKNRILLSKKNFSSLGIALIESIMALFLPEKKT